MPLKKDKDPCSFTGGGAISDLIASKLKGHLHTSLVDGGTILVNADPTKIDLQAGSGHVVDSYTEPKQPVVAQVAWLAQTGIPVVGIGTYPTTFFYIDRFGDFKQQPFPFTAEERRDKIALGVAIHQGAAITQILDFSNTLSNDLGQSFQDYFETTGPVRDNGIISCGNSGSLTFSLTSGFYFGAGYKAIVNKKSPNYSSIVAQDPVSFLTTYKDGSGDWNYEAPSTLLTPGKYDDGTGILANVPPTFWSIQRIYSTEDSNVIQYGPAVYASHTEALEAIQIENFQLNPILRRSLHVGYFVVRNDALDLSDTQFALCISTDGKNSLGPSDVLLPPNVFKQAQIDTRDPTGYIDRSQTVIGFDDATRTFTIAPAMSYFEYYVQGQKYVERSARSVVIPDIEGIHVIYFDGVDLLTALGGDISDEDLFSLYAFTFLVYWDADNKESVIQGRERHGVMPWTVHRYLHRTIGTAYIDGLGLVIPTTSGTGNDDSDAQLAVADGLIIDEDIPIEIEDGDPQVLSPIAQIPTLYRSGLDADNLWRLKEADNFHFVYGGTAGYAGSRLPYNSLVGGVWGWTEVANNDYVLVHLFATNDIRHPIMSAHGQNSYNNLFDAQEGATVELSQINTSGLPGKEFKAIGTQILQTGNYANTPKARARPTETGESYVDFRLVSFVAASAATEHSSTTGRNTANQHAAIAIAPDTTNFDNILSSADDDLQKALETLDEGLLTSPNGTKWKITVDNSGVLSTVAIP